MDRWMDEFHKSKRAVSNGGLPIRRCPQKWGRGLRDGMTESSLRLLVLRYQLDRSQGWGGWVLVGRGRWDCPGSVRTIFRGAPGRGFPRGCPSLLPPPGR